MNRETIGPDIEELARKHEFTVGFFVGLDGGVLFFQGAACDELLLPMVEAMIRVTRETLASDAAKKVIDMAVPDKLRKSLGFQPSPTNHTTTEDEPAERKRDNG